MSKEKDTRVLSGWKEIGAHLDVDQRTAQLWEKERGLPVYRTGKSKRARVRAYPAELERWQRRRSRRRRLRLAWGYGAIGSLLPLVVVLLFFMGVSWEEPGPPATCTVHAGFLEVRDRQGVVAWRKPFPDANGGHYAEDPRLCQVVDVDRDKSPEVLLLFDPIDVRYERGQVILFQEDGQRRWEFTFGGEKRFRGRNFRAHYRGKLLRLIETPFGPVVLGVANQTPYFPSHVFLLDALTGELLDEYWHLGHIMDADTGDLDRDGILEIFLVGVNNPEEGLGYPSLALLRFPRRKEPNSVIVSAEMNDFTGGGEIQYVLFPRPDVFEVQEETWAAISVEILGPEMVEVGIGGGTRHVFFELTPDLEVLNVWLADHFRTWHRALQRSGELDHDLRNAEVASWKKVQHFSETPDGNSPEIRALFEEWAEY